MTTSPQSQDNYARLEEFVATAHEVLRDIERLFERESHRVIMHTPSRADGATPEVVSVDGVHYIWIGYIAVETPPIAGATRKASVGFAHGIGANRMSVVSVVYTHHDNTARLMSAIRLTDDRFDRGTVDDMMSAATAAFVFGQLK
jgi:hypothetical protein